MDPRAIFEEMALGHTRLELRCLTFWAPDHGWPVVQRPADFLVVVFGGVLSYLAPGAARVIELERDALIALQADARAAVEAGMAGRGGVDTAVGRPYTDLRLDIDAIDHGSGTLRFTFNHYHSVGAYTCDALHRLLTRLEAELARDASFDRAPWELVRSRLRPPRDPLWEAGLVVELAPGARRDIAVPDAGFYVRLGQPPGDSPLYRVSVDDHGLLVEQVVSRDEHTAFRVPREVAWSPPAPADPFRSTPEPELRVRLPHTGRSVVLEAGTGRKVYVQKP